ncbi:ABC transporter substrate-binding protein [Paenibacillus sp. OV219]|uniref:ABC transporter substrate-binding protein n=1 Tax=Paenibacillus sp. OV219 TaxID=1884377 RepID=UPI0008C3C8C7|nr:ABC transporter substrate-binding protein [Paenibacillus sp. OV219]SEN28488.1 ABC-type Fe3+-hydroxamate transport system, substrate-binding protein [Paenibacillus sp. OV219]
MKKLVWTGCIGIGALIIAGCSSTDNGQKDNASASASTNVSANANANTSTNANTSANAATEAVSIVDGRGKEVVLKNGYAKNFVLFPNEGTEIFSITQSVEPFLGMRKGDQESNIAGGAVAKQYPEILKVNNNIMQADGSAPNVEGILKLAPDVVYQWTTHGDGAIKPLEDAGVNVVAVNWGTYEDDIERYTLYGKALGKQDRVDEVFAHQAKAKEDVLKVTQNLTEDERQDHVFVSAINDNQINVWGTELPHTPVHKVENAAFTKGKISDIDADINVETLLKWDPDMIVIGEWAKDITPDYFFKHPVLKNLRAVKEKRVYKSPTASLLDNPGINWYFYSVLAYPDKFKGFDMRKQVREDYKLLYNIDLTEEDIDSVLNVAENKTSKNFDLFMQ